MKIDQLIRSHRKSIAILVDNDGKVIVRAPHHVSQKCIQEFVDEKTAWIRAKQTQAQLRPPRVKTFRDGEKFWYLGKEYPLKIIPHASPSLRLEDRFYISQKALPQARQVFTDWYRGQARKVITVKVEKYAGQYGFKYQRIRISSARTRWGSCSTRGSLNFSWRLVMTPRSIIDYVVVHELVHLWEQNHSRRFWSKVGEILPDYQSRRQWLKKNCHLFTFD